MRKKILVADDSITIQKVIEMAFSGRDYEVFCASDGKEAREKFSHLQPDIVLADVIMPDMDGYSLCSTIKSTPEFSHIPVFLLSGAFEPFDREKAESSGADGIITKPFDSKLLVEKVEHILNPPPAPPVAYEEEAFKEAEIEDFPISLDDAIEITDQSTLELFESKKQEVPNIHASDDSVPFSSMKEEAESLIVNEIPPTSEGPAMRLTNQEIDAIAKKLITMIADSPLRQIIRDAISEIAEKIIRERIRELEEKASE